jgi:hypothetical protein
MICEPNPDLLYIQITAWATVALVGATIFMIWWQITSSKAAASLQLSMQVIDRYDVTEFRDQRQALASALLSGQTPSARGMEPLLDMFETLAHLDHRKLLDRGIVDSAFSLPVMRWWRVLEPHVVTMREAYRDSTVYDGFERLATRYEAEDRRHNRPKASADDLQIFLKSEAG